MSSGKAFFLKNKKWIFTLVLVLIYFALVFPYLRSIFYALPYSDDFCMTLKEPGNIFIGSLKETGNKWLNWSGEFIYFFLQYFINPLAYVSLDSYFFGITLCIFFIAFLLSLSFFNFSWLKNFFGFKDSYLLHSINILLIAIVLCANNYHEIYYWFVGSSYMWEYTFAFFAIGSMIRYFFEIESSKKYYISMTVLGIIACNAVNMCVNIGFTYLVLAFLYLRKEKKKLNLNVALPFILYVVMGIFTVFAPGNFSRRGVVGGSSGMVKALANAITKSIVRIYNLLENESVFFLIICLFFVGLIFNIFAKQKVKKMWIVIPIMAMCLFGTLFPVAVGYGDTPILNNRVCYVLDMVTIPCIEIFSLWLGMYIPYKYMISFSPKDYLFVGVIIVIAAYVMLVKDDGISSCEYANQIKNFKKAKQERVLWEGIYNEIYNSKEKEVVITIPDEKVVISGVIQNPGLDEDPDFWINSEIRRYFKKESISVILDEWAY